ncbi:uncharacterized protein LOC109855785 [Pseudomyrmex gracilis]|uniref:uncharacterized protein LOC109855785 n=1 Tax=Pseudomyrmex gracilis TaxID=219809 RepID=UPI000994C82D|nr:uncharacterized protein LOC109855785 [Pseudomyrmex gracilis]
MSHSVTIRTHTVTTSSSTIIINTGYMKTWSGILKLLELAFGIVCVGIIGNEFTYYTYYLGTPECFFLVTTSAFLIGTFIIFLSCLLSLSTATILSKSLYELLYHSIAFGLLLAASLTLIIHVNNYYKHRSNRYELVLGASICGLINTALYLVSTIIALRGYRSL